MERLWPACRGARYSTEITGPHGPHEFFPNAWAGVLPCPGWDEGSAGAAEIIDRTEEAVREWHGNQPPGVRVECHPLALMYLCQVTIPSYAEFAGSLFQDPMALFGVPVGAIAGMERGAWRLASDDGTLASGVVRDGTR